MTRYARTLVLIFLGAVAGITAPAAADDVFGDPEKIVAVFSLDRTFTEKPMGDDMLFGASGAESFQELIARLDKAKDDSSVQAVLVLGGTVGLGNAQIEAARRALRRIRDAGKEVYVHADSISMRSYVLLAGASRLSVVAGGSLWLTGIHGESLHLRGLLDMIGVEPDFLTCGAYKSAAETFTRKEPSAEADENLNWLFDGIFDSYVRQMAEGRETSEATVRGWIDTGLYSAAAAKEAGIIDAVEFRHDLVEHMKQKHGDDIKFDKRYGKKKEQEIDFSSFAGIIRFYGELLSGPRRRTSKKDAIAIVHVEGPIMTGKPDPNAFPLGSSEVAYSTPIRRALDEVAKDDKVKGVVLRVNSPGGSAVASEIILQATRRVKDEKPFTVSMGNVAGSGGYYVACAADQIFAEPSTITASIGVVGGKLATGSMWNRLGVTWKEYERGANAGLLASSEPFTDEEERTLQAWMDEIYEIFKGHVLTSRKDRLKKEIDELAGGRVFTGKQALELGLVDRLGGLEEAITHVAEAAGVEDYEVRVVPRPKNFAELLTESLRGGDDSDDSSISLPVNRALRGANSVLETALPHLRKLEPRRALGVHRALELLNVLQQEQVMLSMPAIYFAD